jgi:hypothetical protein
LRRSRCRVLGSKKDPRSVGRLGHSSAGIESTP